MTETFDAVAWMRRRRTEIDIEDEGLAWEERSRKTLKLLEKNPRWQRLSKRILAQRTAGQPLTAVSSPPRREPT